MPVKSEINVRIILESPPAGVDYGIQKGNGNKYETIAKQRSEGKDLQFDFTINIKNRDPLSLDFSGPFVQGPVNGRFIYIDIGTAAGQLFSNWSRRLKIPLKDISVSSPELLIGDIDALMKTTVPGKAKDGSPNCATVKPFDGWQLVANDLS